MNEPTLDRSALEHAFRLLGDRLARRGVVADLYVFGGAAMALAYDARRSTRDIDAVFEPHGIVLQEAEAVARELGLPRWWLNEQASAYVAPGGDPDAARVFDHPGLRVVAASPRHLLAMKVLAARRRDTGDITFLIQHLGLASLDDVLRVCGEVFPDEPVPDRARLGCRDARAPGRLHRGVLGALDPDGREVHALLADRSAALRARHERLAVGMPIAAGNRGGGHWDG